MVLNTLWFCFVAVLFAGFFFLEGFDYGVGILSPILGRRDEERRAILRTIGPHWDGNEVWLVTAGGALFAAFPRVYAALFSAFYLPVVFLLTALILRGVGLEYRNKVENSRWRLFWDWAIFFGSLLPAFLWGVVMGNWLRGFAIEADGYYYGGLLPLLNPYALFSGLVVAMLFVFHGAVFLTRKAPLEIAERAEKYASSIWSALALGIALFLYMSWRFTDIFSRPGLSAWVLAIVMIIAFLAAGLFLYRRRSGMAFVCSALTVLSLVAVLFVGLYPRLLISIVDPAYDLTIQNAASSPYTLRVMTIVAVVLLPIVLTYQGWTYWVFRRRVADKTE